MKVEGKLFWYLVPPFLAFWLLYGFWSGWNEPVGWVGLLLCAGMVGMIGWYIGVTAKTLPATRPEDDRYGHIDQVAGHYGNFAPYSWQPLWLALSGAVVFMGVAIGWWMVVLGVAMLIFSVIGWTYEYFSGPHHV